MTDGEKKKSNDALKSSLFTHKGVLHYSHGYKINGKIEGYYIDCVIYHSMADMGLADKEIFRQYGKKIQKIKPEAGDVKIKNIRALMEYMYTIMTDKWVTQIKANIKKDMSAYEVFDLFPEPFRWILRLRYLYDKGLKGKAGPEVKRGIHRFSKEMILKGEQDG